jgi:hypothetical protein
VADVFIINKITIFFILDKKMKYVLVIFIFNKQGKIYLTNIDEHQRRTIYYQHISESDTYDINNVIKYELNIRIDLKYKRSRLYDIGIYESKDKEHKYYLYCYRIKKYNEDYIFGRKKVELKDIYKEYDELYDRAIKMVYDKIHDVTRMIAKKSYLVERIKSSWNVNKPESIKSLYYDPMKFGFHPKSDISRYYNEIVCSKDFKYDESKEFTLEIVDKINIDMKKDERKRVREEDTDDKNNYVRKKPVKRNKISKSDVIISLDEKWTKPIEMREKTYE